MSTYPRPSSGNMNSRSEENFQSLFTVEGYKKIFDDSDNVSTSYVLLHSFFPKNFDLNHWNGLLNKLTTLRENPHLANYFRGVQDDLRTRDEKILVKYIEVFSLLECVFRNALCRSYIPAYRSINMDCGRYRCYIGEKEDKLLKQLGFQESSDNLITYSDQDQSKTVILALTCAVYWYEFFKVFETKK